MVYQTNKKKNFVYRRWSFEIWPKKKKAEFLVSVLGGVKKRAFFLQLKHFKNSKKKKKTVFESPVLEATSLVATLCELSFFFEDSENWHKTAYCKWHLFSCRGQLCISFSFYYLHWIPLNEFKVSFRLMWHLAWHWS